MSKSNPIWPGRKAYAVIAAAGVVLTSPAVAEDLGASFEILRKGQPIGTHVVTVRREGSRTVVNTDIKMRVKLGPVPVFIYRHESREVWLDGTVQAIESETNNNGRRSSVTVQRAGDRLTVDGTAYDGPAPLDAVPSSYWNRAIVDASVLLNTQNGELIDISTTALGRTAAPGGGEAEHFRVVGTVALDLWYDGPRWVGSTFTVRGEDLTYRPLVEKRTVEARLAN